MDEQQLLQLLNQIPLDVLQNYVAQRMQQEQAAQQAVPAEEAQPTMMSYGGGIPAGYDPYIDVYRVPVGILTTTRRMPYGRRRKKK